jgi:hypothetical protein
LIRQWQRFDVPERVAASTERALAIRLLFIGREALSSNRFGRPAGRERRRINCPLPERQAAHRIIRKIGKFNQNDKD